MRAITHFIFGLLLFGMGCAQHTAETDLTAAKSEPTIKAEPEEIQVEILVKDAPTMTSTPQAAYTSTTTIPGVGGTQYGSPTMSNAGMNGVQASVGPGFGAPGAGFGAGVGPGIAGPGIGAPGIAGPGIAGPGVVDPGLGVGIGGVGPGFGLGIGPGFGPGVFPVVGAAVPLVPWAVGPWFGGDDGGEWDNWSDDDRGNCRDKCKPRCKGRCNEPKCKCGHEQHRPWPDDDSAISKRAKSLAKAKTRALKKK